MSDDGPDQERPAHNAGGPIPFNYIKSNDFRVIHVDGAIGSITPRGFIHAALYNERVPIPTLMVHPIGPDGNLMPPIQETTKPGVVREVEVSLLLDRNAAESLRVWLGEQISDLDRLQAMVNEKKAAKEP